MRKEETNRKELERMTKSKYAEYYCDQAGVLMWVLGNASTPRSGSVQLRKQLSEPTS